MAINKNAVTTGTLAAFNSIGDVLCVASNPIDGVYLLSVSNPHFAHDGDKSISDVVRFRFDTGAQIMHLATTYSYQVNAQQSLTDVLAAVFNRVSMVCCV